MLVEIDITNLRDRTFETLTLSIPYKLENIEQAKAIVSYELNVHPKHIIVHTWKYSGDTE